MQTLKWDLFWRELNTKHEKKLSFGKSLENLFYSVPLFSIVYEKRKLDNEWRRRPLIPFWKTKFFPWNTQYSSKAEITSNYQ